MFGSLRVRLPLVLLAGIILAGLVTTLISVRLFRDFSHDQALAKLSSEANGIAHLYATSVNESYALKNGKKSSDRGAPSNVTAKSLELATGDQIFILGPHRLFPGLDSQPIPGLQHFPAKTSFDWLSGKSGTFEFTLPGTHRRYYAVANPIVTGKPGSSPPFGAIVVATKKTDVSARVFDLIERLTLAGMLGLLVAALLAGYLSHRIVRPVLQLSDAADAVARGEYDVQVPQRAPGELGHLSERFGEMAARLAEVEEMERNFLMSVSHELRTPLTAIRGHVSALLEGVVDDPERACGIARDGGGRGAAARAARRRHPRSREARHAPLHGHDGRGRHGAAARPGVRAVPRGGAATVDRLPPGGAGAAGDHLGRRPRAAGRRQPALERVPRDAGRRPHLTRARAAERHRHVAVEDNGPGHPAEMRERLFRPFVSETGGGTGLGLAIAKELSAALGGRLDLELGGRQGLALRVGPAAR